MLTYNEQFCHTLIPSGYTSEESHDPSLDIVYASSQMFRGRDGTSLRTLLRESLHAHYEALLDTNGNHGGRIPNDF